MNETVQYFCKKMCFPRQVTDPCSSVDDVKASLENAVAQLKTQGLLSAETVGQLINSFSYKLNSQSDQSNSADRQKVNPTLRFFNMSTVSYRKGYP